MMDMVERARLIAENTPAGEFRYATDDTDTGTANKYHFTYCEQIKPGYAWLSPAEVVRISNQIIDGTYVGQRKNP